MSRNDYVKICKEENKAIFNGKYMVQYQRNKHGCPTGLVLAFKKNGKIMVGWSKCNTKLETFDKHIGLNKAYYKAFDLNSLQFTLKHEPYLPNIPHSLKHTLHAIINRACRYYKKEALNVQNNFNLADFVVGAPRLSN